MTISFEEALELKLVDLFDGHYDRPVLVRGEKDGKFRVLVIATGDDAVQLMHLIHENSEEAEPIERN